MSTPTFLRDINQARVLRLLKEKGVLSRAEVAGYLRLTRSTVTLGHATIDMHLSPGLRYSNCFWALPEKHVYMANGYRGQVIMVFPHWDVVAVTTGRANFSLNEIADLISRSVKSDTSLPADAASMKLLADKILDVSTEKPTEVGPTSKMAGIISGRAYRFPPNKTNVESLSLIL